MSSNWLKHVAAVMLAIAVPSSGLAAAEIPSRTWKPDPSATEIPLWPAHLAIERPVLKGPETAADGGSLVAGKSWTKIENVERPSMIIYPAKGVNTGASVLVFPGGGYQVLAIDLEGTEICDWLTAKGITCVILKYRVMGSGPYWDPDCDCRKIPTVPMALQDAQRAMGLLRQSAATFRIDPKRIGVIGFSAGGHLVADVSNRANRAYNRVDQADRQSSIPNFAIALYPGHLWEEPFSLNPTVRVLPSAPPTFLLHAEDDPVDDVSNSLVYFLALKEAKIPTEMHVYARGGHAFGLRPTSNPISGWPTLVEKWMRSIGVLEAAPGRN